MKATCVTNLSISRCVKRNGTHSADAKLWGLISKTDDFTVAAFEFGHLVHRLCVLPGFNLLHHRCDPVL